MFNLLKIFNRKKKQQAEQVSTSVKSFSEVMAFVDKSESFKQLESVTIYLKQNRQHYSRVEISFAREHILDKLLENEKEYRIEQISKRALQ